MSRRKRPDRKSRSWSRRWILSCRPKKDADGAAAPEAGGPGDGRAAGSAPEEDPLVDYDPDVASIFTEEATELLEVCESQLAAWRTDPANAERPAALKRPLHTLKGGARMAGIMAMGDLSHELESLVNFIDSGGVLAECRGIRCAADQCR